MPQNKYIKQSIEKIEKKHANMPEYIQAVKEFFLTLENYIREHPEIEEHNILELIAEPERIIQFRVPWQDDQGNWKVNLAWRVQFNSTLGPYKGGIRFHPKVNESILRFLGFEQTFKNALTSLPLGGGKGGSDFDPHGKSNDEIMRFTQSLMTELHKYLGPDLDIPAGDIGVGHHEIAYMYGQYKRLKKAEPGVITGKPTSLWGSFGRTEATGYGLIYFAEEALKDQDDRLKNKKVVISGTGNVARYAIKKATELGATVIAASDSQGYVYDEDGIDFNDIIELAKKGSGSLKYYSDIKTDAQYFDGESVWDAAFEFDIAFPCATENEINQDQAINLVKNCKITSLFEGANMPNTDEAVKVYKENKILYAPGKAANAGGVAVSALEMTQNAQYEQWTSQEVDQRLQTIMQDIYELVSQTAEKYADKNDLQTGANIAGFVRVAKAMIEQGLV
ncbi:MAG: NADP-specific glutamate dehydrogenase [Atopostipes sp.]|nr:NADP-specific glutamate dehydrogenase [Atopostipes sp.]